MALLAALSASIALADDFKTIKGKEYKNATVSHVEPDGIVIKFKSGIVKILFTELPKDVQLRFGYDTNKIEAEKEAEHAALIFAEGKRIQEQKAAERERAEKEKNAEGDLKRVVTSPGASAQTGAKELNPTEKWVVAQVTAGEIADLSKQFPDNDEKRKLSARFLEDLLTGALPGVKLHRKGVRIIGAIIDEPIDLTNAQIPCEVDLEHCQFMTTATFEGATFTGMVSFSGSAFKADADFGAIKVGQSAAFNDAVFEGPVDFTLVDIAGTFTAQAAKFQNKEKGASFTAMKVGGYAFFDDAVFEGPVAFIEADIARDFTAGETQFTNKEQTATFAGMKVGGVADLPKAVFEGPVTFTGGDISVRFVADEAQFCNKEQTAYFEGMKVGGDASFNKAVFEGPVDFIEADIARDFTADEAQFRNKEQFAMFQSMKVGGNAFFRMAVFEGPVNFAFSDFAVLDLSGAGGAGPLYLQGMSYKKILAAPDEPKSHKALLNLADHSAYTVDVYSNLEEFFKHQGDRADADRAFIRGKLRERKEYFHSGDWSRWLGSWMLYLLVGYGRHPWQAGIACAVVIALGCVLFSPNKMEPQKREDTPLVYSRFWYSLNLFLPVVDLQAGKMWKPKADQTFLRNYMRVHILLGWILIPLVLAAVTGLIK